MRLKDFQDGTYRTGQSIGVGGVVGVVSARVDAARTEPPDRYTEQSLLDDMTSAHKFAADANERAVLSEISGLGTSRTRASIIGNLIDRGLLARQAAKGRAGRKKEVLVSSPHAREIARKLPAQLTSVATTAKWELGFRMVEEGRATPEQMKAHLDRALVAIVEDAKRHGAGGVVAAVATPAGMGSRPKPANSLSKANGLRAQSGT